ncbi:phage holin family protein [Candidatus Shapirobacteria bacterium]|nr:phage holin family protein [Candidatus Shapirobacteria bacterium]
MKKILKFTLLFSFALVCQNQFWQNFQFSHGVETIIKVALIYTIFELFLKPILKLLLLPINLLTLGLFRLVINTVGLYLAVFFLADFAVNDINLPSQSIYGLALPQIQFGGFLSFLINSFSTNIIVGFFKFILKSNKVSKK